jgi:periplasmic mercuric ion binding protein
MKNSLLLIVVLFAANFVSAQEAKKKKTETIVILTSSECGSCKERIENMLNYTKGIIFADLEVKSKKVTIKYKPAVITSQQIKQKIAELGYDADEVKAVKAGVEKLPACCKPGGMKK